MKKLAVVTIFTLLLGAGLQAQYVIMKIADITDKTGDTLSAVDFRTKSDVSIASGGLNVAKPVLGDFIVKKNYDTSSTKLYQAMLNTTLITEVVFEFYKSDSNKPYQTIKLGKAFITEFDWLSPECPSCQQIIHQIGFKAQTYELINLNDQYKYDASTVKMI